MNTKELIRDHEYRYTAGTEWVRVVFKHETINRYVFAYEGTEHGLHVKDVEAYIEEIG